MIHKFIHEFKPELCINHLIWREPSKKNKAKYAGISQELVCSKCGCEIAFQWDLAGRGHFVHQKFIGFMRKIESMLYDDKLHN